MDYESIIKKFSESNDVIGYIQFKSDYSGEELEKIIKIGEKYNLEGFISSSGGDNSGE